jgi:putative copper export protein
MVLVGSVFFVVFLWPAGGRLERTRTVLKVSLIAAVVANVATLGLKGAAVSGRDAWSLFSSEALTALEGTHPGRTLTARLVLLGLAIPVVAYLAWVPERARRSVVWSVAALVTIGGAVFTHGQLSHGYADGSLAAVVDVVHLSAVSVWLGGLVMLAAVVLPRRRPDELAELVPRYSDMAFKAVSTATVAGIVLLLLLSPAWSELPGNAYGRYLFVKLSLVVVLLAAAARSRTFVRRKLTGLTADARTGERVAVAVGAGPGRGDLSAGGRSTEAGPPPEVDAVSLKPFVTSVVAELVIAAGILGATALLVGRSVPT